MEPEIKQYEIPPELSIHASPVRTAISCWNTNSKLNLLEVFWNNTTDESFHSNCIYGQNFLLQECFLQSTCFRIISKIPQIKSRGCNCEHKMANLCTYSYVLQSSHKNEELMPFFIHLCCHHTSWKVYRWDTFHYTNMVTFTVFNHMFHGMWILSAFYLLPIREASRMRVQHATLMHEPRVK